jgi:hypothetical protein
MQKLLKHWIKIIMSIQQKISDFENAFGQKLPQFYVDFIVKENLENSKLFNDLTSLYGLDDLLQRQEEFAGYLPNHLKIGNDSGDYGVFISLIQPENQTENTAIYIVGMGDLDEAALEKLADNFADWAKKDFDTEIFLENLYHKQTQFKRAQINAPIFDLKEQISALNKQLNAASHQKSAGKLDLKSYLLLKKDIEANKEILNKKLIEHESALLQANNHAASRASPLINPRIIENTFDIKLPFLYKKLHDDGMLEYANAFGSDWYEKVYPSLCTQPPFLLFAHPFELMRIRDVYAEFREQREGMQAENKEYPYDTWRDDFWFVPFGGDGSGDKFAFYWQAENTELDVEPMIIHWWHDSDHCEIKAKNLADFMFIQMLNCAFELDDEYYAVDEETNADLNNMLATHEKYLTLSQAQVLKQIYARDWFSEDGNSFLLNLAEYKQILLQEIGYCDDLGSFIYTKG